MAVLLGSGCSSSDSLPPAHADNPLRECPDSPNCERVSARYPVPPERLYAGATTALDALGPIRLQAQSDSIQASAVYRVALVFKDDVDVAVDSISDGSRLHVRSASRLGHSDLGVNRRRVQHLLSRVDDALDATSN
ncbi:MAG: DUF1499 domain-containing protein [Bacteroidetes bacterium SW_9_63_38]|nr:MAG: DUF1499 domain-containing protein [Bacteroidetes bacterium SW_9_63_38]